MNEQENQETMKEAYKRVFDYDPTDEEVNARYSDKFNEWCDNFLKNKSSK